MRSSLAGAVSKLVLTAVAAVVVALSPVPAHGQGGAEVFLLPFEPLGPGVSASVVSRINENVQRQLRSLRVNFTTEVARDAGGRGGDAALREAQQEYQRGIGLYVVQDYAAAVTAFEASVAGFSRAVGEIGDFRAVPDALFKLAESYYRTGNEDMARVTLMRALAIRPDAPPAEEAGQAFAQFYASVGESLRRQGRGAILVESNPAGMTVVVNGQEHGPAPVTVEELPAGEHFVQVRGADGQGSGRVVTVQRGRTMEVRLDAAREAATQAAQTAEPRYLRSLREEVQRGTISDALIPFMRELATRQGVRFVVVGVVVKRDRTFEALPFIYRASDGLFAEITPQEYDDELANITAHSYQQAAHIQAALRNFPENRLVTGVPIIAVAEAPLPGMGTPAAEEDRATTVMAVPVVAPSAAPRERPRTAEPAPAPAPAPAPSPEPSGQAAWGQQPAQQPAQQQPAWGQQPAQQPAQQQPAWGQQPAQQPAQQQPAWGQQPAQQPAQQQPAWGQQPAQQPAQQQPAWGQQPAQQQPAWGQQPAQQQPAWGQQPVQQQPAWGQQPVQQQPGWGQDPGAQQGGWGAGSQGGVARDVDRERDSVFRKPWFWGVVGGVVAAGVVTAIVVSSGGGDGGGVQPVLTW